MQCEIDEQEGSITISYERSQDFDNDKPLQEREAQAQRQPEGAAAGAKQRERSGKAEEGAELQESDALAEPTWHVTERAWGRVSRTVALPEDAEWGKAEAKLEHGELTLTIPRRKPEGGEGAHSRRRALSIA